MKLFLVAGEPSGDRLGAALMAGLKVLAPGVSFSGVAGPLMQAEGMASLFPMEELSVMGIAEVLPKYLHLRRRLHQSQAIVGLDAAAHRKQLRLALNAIRPACAFGGDGIDQAFVVTQLIGVARCAVFGQVSG